MERVWMSSTVAVVSFSTLSCAFLQELSLHMQEESFEAGEVLFEQGEEASHLFIIEEGLINVTVNFLRLSPDESQVPIPDSLQSQQRDR